MMMEETLSSRLFSHCSQTPNKICLHLLEQGTDTPITYQQLVDSSAALQQILQERGIQQGEVILLILEHGLDLVRSFFGCVLHGAVPSIMPFLTEKLLPERYRADLAALIKITRPAAILTYPDFESEIRKALQPEDSVRQIILVEATPANMQETPQTVPGLARRSDDVVLLQHSSGTTGLQKGVALSHQAIFNQLEVYARALNVQPGDVVISWLPLYHDMGLIAGFLMPILSGIPLVMMSPFEWVRAPHKLLQAVSAYRGTITWLPNFAYNFCAQKIRDRQLEGIDLASWRLVINCSEPMRWESHQLFYQRFKAFGLKEEALATCYAMAENVFAVTQGGVDQPVTVDWVDRKSLQQDRLAVPVPASEGALAMLSAGKPLENCQLKICAPEGAQLPERQIGEIALKSNCMLTNYYHRPDATAEVLREGWFFTGDYGYLAEGELYITGRKKEIIIVGGKNIYPQDLEYLAYQVPGVHGGRAVAFGLFNEQSGTEDVVLVAEVDTADAQEKAAITEAIRQQINTGSAVAIRHIHLVGAHWLIKTSSGKNARLANKEKYIQEMGQRE
jgi:acyl-CoA synthetase (AMP-forming)/AMP-acid ligase II